MDGQSKNNSSPNKENNSPPNKENNSFPNFKTITPGDGRTYEYYWYRHQPESVFIGFLNLGIGSGIVKTTDTMVDVAELFSCTGDQARMVLSIANDLLETNEDIN